MIKVVRIPGTTPSAEVTAWSERAREDRFDGVEIEIGEGRTCDLSADVDSCRALHESAERCGTRIIAASLAEPDGSGISSRVEQDALAARERVRTAAEICRRLSATTLRIVPVAAESPGGARRSYQDALNETYRSLQVLRGDFERAGVVGAVEVCRHHFLLSPPEMRELIDRVNSPWVGAALDWAVCADHGDPLDWVETLGPHLRAVVLGADGGESASARLEQVRFEGVVIASL